MLTSLAGLKFLDWLPPYYRDDAVVADYLQIAGFECDRLAYLLGQFVRQHYIGTSEWLLTTLEAFYALRNPGLTLDLRRAVLLSMTLGHLRLRPFDMADVVRNFLQGPKAYVLQNYTNVTKFRVSNVQDFLIGKPVFVGGQIATLIDILRETNELVVSSPISPYPNALVSQSYVNIVQQYSDYIFNITVRQSDLLSQDELVAAVNRTKPAHLGWRLYALGANIDQGYYDEPASLSDDGDLITDAVASATLLYENVG